MKIIFSIILLLMFTSPVYAETAELKYSIGSQIPKDYFPKWPYTDKDDWSFNTVSLIKGVDITSTLDTTVELSLSKFDFSEVDVTNFSIILGFEYDYVKLTWGSLYLDCGVGLGYWSAFPSESLIDNALPALVQYGTGVKFFLDEHIFVKLGYGFRHDSALFSDEDIGINSHRLEISYGVEW